MNVKYLCTYQHHLRNSALCVAAKRETSNPDNSFVKPQGRKRAEVNIANLFTSKVTSKPKKDKSLKQ